MREEAVTTMNTQPNATLGDQVVAASLLRRGRPSFALSIAWFSGHPVLFQCIGSEVTGLGRNWIGGGYAGLMRLSGVGVQLLDGSKGYKL